MNPELKEIKTIELLEKLLSITNLRGGIVRMGEEISEDIRRDFGDYYGELLYRITKLESHQKCDICSYCMGVNPDDPLDNLLNRLPI